jgi:alpha-glucosidase (family GH31 glycosyl hydrolase)
VALLCGIVTAMTRTLLAATVLVACTSTPPSSDAGTDLPAVDSTPEVQCTFAGAPETDLPEPRLHTPRWAFEPWISKDISTTADTYAFVDGFRTRDIPVGVVVLDSPWETHYNTFIPNPQRYGEFPRLVNDMHMRGVRVVLWITQLVNDYSFDAEIGGDAYMGASPNYAEGAACGFYVNEGARYTWWKGRGASVDFFNPRARAWWHAQQNLVLDAGIDGWKLDFGDSYVTSSRVQTAQGTVPHQQYSEAYYRDFLAYGRARRGDDFLTMVRPWDESYQYPGRFFARREHSPVAWVGDNRRDRVGLLDALDHIFRSAAAGYPVVGSDLGGYLDRDDRQLTREVPYEHATFARWIALGALTPFMQLHGRGNFAPWTVPERAEEITTYYRFWARLHHALVPFWYAVAEEAWRGAAPVLRPVGAMNTWPGDYRYTLGDAFLVAPVLDERGQRDIELPAGTWYDWWNPAGDPIAGASTLRSVVTTDLSRLPLYVREGAIVPLRVEHDGLGVGTSAQAAALTLLVYPAREPSRFTLHEGTATGVVSAVRDTASTVRVSLPPQATPWYLRVRTVAGAQRVEAAGSPLALHATRAAFDTAATGWWREPETRSVWVKLTATTAETTIVLAP